MSAQPSMPPLAAAFNATRAEMLLNQRAQSGALMPPPVVRPPSVVEVLAEVSRQKSPPPLPQTPQQRQENWDFLRSGAGLPVPGNHILPTTMSSTAKGGLEPLPWSDRSVLTDVAKQWVTPSVNTPVREVLPSYLSSKGAGDPVQHVGILALSSSAAHAAAPAIAPSATATTPNGLEVSQIPDPVYIVKTNSWPWTVRDHWGLPQKVAWLEAIMHPYLVFPYWRDRLGAATGLLYEQDTAGRANRPS
ncbi:MAG TPA: hypothetical protein VGO36_00760 [Solirubrobacterales bacterium]|jgi:hypothetical protein|nr:hypothetical protein [Solirubrobacterales bacterium]